MNFKKEILKLLKDYKIKEEMLEIPSDFALGDYAFPCFVLAKKLKKAPNVIAEEILRKLKPNKYIKKIEAKGSYLNFFVNKDILAENTLKDIFKNKDYGNMDIGKGKKLLIEHTSINPNASPHVGRARNALIGDSLTRILKFVNFKPEIHYFVNDVGKQIAMLVYVAKKNIIFDKLLEIYVKINKRIEKDEKLEKEIFTLLHKLENGDKAVRKRFRNVVNVCINGQNNILSELGIKYDYYDYESKYLWDDSCKKILAKLKKTKRLFKDDDGRLVLNQKGFNLAMKVPVLVLTRADGTSLYPLRDLAYNIDKLKRAEKNIVVLGEDHKLYFQQMKIALEFLKYKAPAVVHYSYILLKTGKMSTRKGEVVLLEDFMKEAVEKAKKEVKKRDKKIKKNQLERLAKIIGYGAIKYSILKVSNEKNVIFDWVSALNFEGDSAPYIQYAHARICSILKKNKGKINQKINFSVYNDDEKNILNKLAEFPKKVEDTYNNFKPHIIANYVYELANIFNEYYHKYPVLKAEEDVKKARLLLIYCIKRVIYNGLSLLGIEAPERM